MGMTSSSREATSDDIILFLEPLTDNSSIRRNQSLPPANGLKATALPARVILQEGQSVSGQSGKSNPLITQDLKVGGEQRTCLEDGGSTHALASWELASQGNVYQLPFPIHLFGLDSVQVIKHWINLKIEDKYHEFLLVNRLTFKMQRQSCSEYPEQWDEKHQIENFPPGEVNVTVVLASGDPRTLSQRLAVSRSHQLWKSSFTERIFVTGYDQTPRTGRLNVAAGGNEPPPPPPKEDEPPTEPYEQRTVKFKSPSSQSLGNSSIAFTREAFKPDTRSGSTGEKQKFKTSTKTQTKNKNKNIIQNPDDLASDLEDEVEEDQSVMEEENDGEQLGPGKSADCNESENLPNSSAAATGGSTTAAEPTADTNPTADAENNTTENPGKKLSESNDSVYEIDQNTSDDNESLVLGEEAGCFKGKTILNQWDKNREKNSQNNKGESGWANDDDIEDYQNYLGALKVEPAPKKPQFPKLPSSHQPPNSPKTHERSRSLSPAPRRPCGGKGRCLLSVGFASRVLIENIQQVCDMCGKIASNQGKKTLNLEQRLLESKSYWDPNLANWKIDFPLKPGYENMPVRYVPVLKRAKDLHGKFADNKTGLVSTEFNSRLQEALTTEKFGWEAELEQKYPEMKEMQKHFVPLNYVQSSSLKTKVRPVIDFSFDPDGKGSFNSFNYRGDCSRTVPSIASHLTRARLKTFSIISDLSRCFWSMFLCLTVASLCRVVIYAVQDETGQWVPAYGHPSAVPRNAICLVVTFGQTAASAILSGLIHFVLNRKGNPNPIPWLPISSQNPDLNPLKNLNEMNQQNQLKEEPPDQAYQWVNGVQDDLNRILSCYSDDITVSGPNLQDLVKLFHEQREKLAKNKLFLPDGNTWCIHPEHFPMPKDRILRFKGMKDLFLGAQDKENTLLGYRILTKTGEIRLNIQDQLTLGRKRRGLRDVKGNLKTVQELKDFITSGPALTKRRILSYLASFSFDICQIFTNLLVVASQSYWRSVCLEASLADKAGNISGNWNHQISPSAKQDFIRLAVVQLECLLETQNITERFHLLPEHPVKVFCVTISDGGSGIVSAAQSSVRQAGHGHAAASWIITKTRTNLWTMRCARALVSLGQDCTSIRAEQAGLNKNGILNNFFRKTFQNVIDLPLDCELRFVSGSDSTAVLQRLRLPAWMMSKYSAPRVEEAQENLLNSQTEVFYVPRNSNCADLLTQGIQSSTTYAKQRKMLCQVLAEFKHNDGVPKSWIPLQDLKSIMNTTDALLLELLPRASVSLLEDLKDSESGRPEKKASHRTALCTGRQLATKQHPGTAVCAGQLAAPQHPGTVHSPTAEAQLAVTGDAGIQQHGLDKNIYNLNKLQQNVNQVNKHFEKMASINNLTCFVFKAFINKVPGPKKIPKSRRNITKQILSDDLTKRTEKEANLIESGRNQGEMFSASIVRFRDRTDRLMELVTIVMNGLQKWSRNVKLQQPEYKSTVTEGNTIKMRPVPKLAPRMYRWIKLKEKYSPEKAGLMLLLGDAWKRTQEMIPELNQNIHYTVQIYRQMGLITLTGRQWGQSPQSPRYKLVVVPHGSVIEKAILWSSHRCILSPLYQQGVLQNRGLFIRNCVSKLKIIKENECYGCLRKRLVQIQTTISGVPTYGYDFGVSLFSFISVDIVPLPSITMKIQTRKAVEQKCWGLVVQCLSTRMVAASAMQSYKAEDFIKGLININNQFGTKNLGLIIDHGSQLIKAGKEFEMKELNPNTQPPPVIPATAKYQQSHQNKEQLKEKTENEKEEEDSFADSDKIKILSYLNRQNCKVHQPTARKPWSSTLESTLKVFGTQLRKAILETKIHSYLDVEFILKEVCYLLNNRTIHLISDGDYTESISPIMLGLGGQGSLLGPPLRLEQLPKSGETTMKNLLQQRKTMKIFTANLTTKYLNRLTSLQMNKYLSPGLAEKIKCKKDDLVYDTSTITTVGHPVVARVTGRKSNNSVYIHYSLPTPKALTLGKLYQTSRAEENLVHLFRPTDEGTKIIDVDILTSKTNFLSSETLSPETSGMLKKEKLGNPVTKILVKLKEEKQGEVHPLQNDHFGNPESGDENLKRRPALVLPSNQTFLEPNTKAYGNFHMGSERPEITSKIDDRNEDSRERKANVSEAKKEVEKVNTTILTSIFVSVLLLLKLLNKNSLTLCLILLLFLAGVTSGNNHSDSSDSEEELGQNEETDSGCEMEPINEEFMSHLINMLIGFLQQEINQCQESHRSCGPELTGRNITADKVLSCLTCHFNVRNLLTEAERAALGDTMQSHQSRLSNLKCCREHIDQHARTIMAHFRMATTGRLPPQQWVQAENENSPQKLSQPSPHFLHTLWFGVLSMCQLCCQWIIILNQVLRRKKWLFLFLLLMCMPQVTGEDTMVKEEIEET